MTIKKLDKKDLVYIAFQKANVTDVVEFKRELHAALHNDNRDIVVDLTKETSVTESEVALLAGAVKELQGTLRTLRVVASPAVYKRLQTNNLHKADNVFLYNGHTSLLDGLNMREKVQGGNERQ